MGPNLAMHNLENDLIGNAVFSGKLGRAINFVFVASPNFPHVIFGKFGARVIYSSRCLWDHGLGVLFATRLTRLANLVSHVVVVGSKKKMRRIAALPIVALVETLQTVRNWSVGQCKRQPVSIPLLAGFRRKRSVATPKATGSPVPARLWAVGLIYLSPESVFHRCGFSHAESIIPYVSLTQQNIGGPIGQPYM